MPPLGPSPISWKKELIGEARTEAWQYAAGKKRTVTDKTAIKHKFAGERVGDLEFERLADGKPDEERREEKKRILLKVKNPREYRKSNKGNSRGKSILPPPDN